MLRMAQQKYIKDLYENEGLSLREISRRTGCCFETVRKYAYKEDWSENELPNLNLEHYPVLEAYIPTIDEWLEADRKAPRKQRRTAKRIFDRLREERGFGGSYSCEKRYVRKKKQALRINSEGYLPLEQPEGWAQVDFGEVRYNNGQGQLHTGYELVRPLL